MELSADPWLDTFNVASVAVPPHQIPALMLALAERGPDHNVDFGDSLRFWMAVVNFIVELLAEQRFVPTLSVLRGNGLRAAWQPWLHDDEIRDRLVKLVRAMPPAARAGDDRHHSQPWSILDEALRVITDAAVRAALTAEQFSDAVEDRDPATDAHVVWLAALLGWNNEVPAGAGGAATALLRDANQWIARLDDRGQDRPLHLCLRIAEPSPTAKATLNGAPPWTLSLHLQSPDDPNLLIDAAAIWNPSPSSIVSRMTSPEVAQELLLAELGRASRIYPKIESALAEKHPTHLELTTIEAYEFLRQVRPVLEESGIAVIAPDWWDQPLGRLAARLHIDAPSTESLLGAAGTSPAASVMGLNSLVKFRWQIAIGDQPLSMEEFRALAEQSAPLVQVRGKWVEVSPEQLADAREFIEKTPVGEMTLLEAIQISHGAGAQHLRLPVHGMDATGWVADFLNATGDDRHMPLIEQPEGFTGALRPYQKTGLSWLAFLDRFGLGACLADDMGLGKTIQLIGLLLHEREIARRIRCDAGTPATAASHPADMPETQGPGIEFSNPTLLVIPTSVIANWVRELNRFAPSLKVHVQHGPDRPLGDSFARVAAAHDLVLTTYPLISRDIDTLRRVRWHRVVLDEAQYIKNPPTKQTTAIRSLHAPRRVALTGTPVENRLSELWSIMEFCNPGFLGSAGEFRRRFGIPIERHHNRLQADRLRQMVRPFVLRRVKTDPKVISDLPDLTETKEFATLTVEQAAMYQHIVNTMLGQVDRATGIQRRGLVLAALVRLKQVCNHPSLAKGQTAEEQDGDAQPGSPPILDVRNSDERLAGLSMRSGKAKRLMVMLEEVIASGEKALIFTQFRQMGHLLTAMIRNELDCETLFLHGGTPATKRQDLIDRFQSDSGGVPIFVLSLKAGGLGLNLTAANHVFHYDRWWNPAVENQATDRAFRIGQMRAVQVHKFVCLGTLEERIDQMIEQKTELAQNIIGAGEQWLTELSTNQLHDLLMLRPSAMEGES